MKDKLIICAHCGQAFYFTVGEQKFYENKNYPDPKRCRLCREIKRKEA